MEDNNSTGAVEIAEAPGGEQQGAVAPAEQSPSDEGRETVVGSRHADFELVDADSGEPEEKDGKADAAEAAEPDGAGQANAKTQAQTREENAAIRAARLRERRETETAAAARADAEIAGSGVVNPYTGKPFASVKEFREYGERVKRAELTARAKKTGQSVDELSEEEQDRAFIRAQRKAQELQAAVDAQRSKQRSFIEDDVLDFVEKHPEFGEKELSELEKNQSFREFCGTRFGREPLSKLYDSYVKLVGAAGAAAEAKATDRRARSTGSGTGGGVVLSPAQKSALDRWNAENPEMAMTAKEFLRR